MQSKVMHEKTNVFLRVVVTFNCRVYVVSLAVSLVHIFASTKKAKTKTKKLLIKFYSPKMSCSVHYYLKALGNKLECLLLTDISSLV